MGFFSKIFKGVKKVFKKIGKGIKSAFKSVGKFMGKLGIIGQIGLGLLLPGLGGMLGSWAGTLMKSGSFIARGAGQFINAAVNIGTKIGSTFKTITEGVTSVIGETVGAVANKLGLAEPLSNIGIKVGGKDFSSVFGKVSDAVSNIAGEGKNLFSMDTLTGLNKYAVKSQALALAKGPNLTDTPNISRIEIPEAPTPQMSALDAGNTTNLVDFKQPSLLAQDMVVPPVSVEGLKGLDLSGIDVDVSTGTVADTVAKEAVEETPSWITDQVKTGVEDFVAKTKGAVTDLGGNLVNKAFDINQPADVNVTNIRSFVPTLNLSGEDIYAGSPQGVDPMAYTRDLNVSTSHIGHQGLQRDVYLNFIGGSR